MVVPDAMSHFLAPFSEPLGLSQSPMSNPTTISLSLSYMTTWYYKLIVITRYVKKYG